MKVPVALSFFSFAQIFVSSHIDSVEQETYAMSYAVRSVAGECFMEKFTNIRIISSYEENAKVKMYDFVSQIVQLLQPKMKVTMEEPKSVQRSSKRRGSPVIIIVHSQKSFDLIKTTFAYNNMRFRKFILLVLIDGFFPNREQISKAFWDHQIHNVNLLSAELDGSVGMYSFYPFAEENCGNNTKLYLVNSFDIRNFSWSTEVFYECKFKNLNKCKLRVAALAPSVPSVILNIDNKGIKTFTGLEIEIVLYAAKEYNLTAVFHAFKDIGTIMINGSTTPGVLQAVRNKTYDVTLGTLSLQYERVQFLTETFPVMSVPIIVVVPPTSLIPPIKKLTRPFSLFVWISIIFSAFLGIVVVCISKWSCRRKYHFLVGRNVHYPVLNMLIGLLGGSQNKLPASNFARYLLMKFLLCCLVIRSMYQAKVFIMLQLELREDQVETVDDMIAKNMTFYAYESFARRIQQFPFTNSCKIIPNPQIDSYRRKTLDSSFNGAVFSYLSQILYLNNINRKNFTYIVAKEIFVTNQLVFYFQSNHYLAEGFSKKIYALHESGLIQKLAKKYMDPHIIRSQQASKKPAEPLGFTQLSGIFSVWACLLLLSTVAFLVEHICSFQCRRQAERAVNK